MHQSALIEGRPGAPVRVLNALASTRLTLALLALLAAAVVIGYRDESLAVVALTLALAALAVNFAAALVLRPAFRSQAPLLVVHAALFAVVLLVGVGKMTRLQGRVELTQGVPFDGTLIDRDAGPWHADALAQARFVHEGFTIEYAPGLKRGRTRNAVQWIDDAGRPQRAVIGDQEPLVRKGYRFYTTPNKGFAPVFTWQPAGAAAAVQGAVHLPSYPAHALRQAREWTLPDGAAVWVKLASEDVLIDPERAGAFALPPVKDVVVRIGDTRHVLRVGDTLELPAGRLRYAALRTWMGYRVYYDPTLPWLLVASTLAALALGVHFWLRFGRQSWRAADAAAEPVSSAAVAPSAAPAAASFGPPAQSET